MRPTLAEPCKHFFTCSSTSLSGSLRFLKYCLKWFTKTTGCVPFLHRKVGYSRVVGCCLFANDISTPFHSLLHGKKIHEYLCFKLLRLFVGRFCYDFFPEVLRSGVDDLHPMKSKWEERVTY